MTRINISIKLEQVFLSVFIFCAINLKVWSQESELPPNVSKKAVAATVGIICNGVSTGSGIVIGISDEGRAVILTTPQVVSSNFAEADANTPLEFYDTIEVTLPTGEAPIAAQLLAEFVDRDNHLALVGTKSPVLSERVISYSQDSKVRPGQQVIIFGFSETSQLSLTTSRIVLARDQFLVVDTRLPARSSGGPIVDNDGRMVGLATSLITGQEDTQGYGIRIEVVSAVVNSWLAGFTGFKLTWRSEGKGFPTLWVVGGAIVVGGGTAAVLALSGGGKGGGFPKPPVRPEGN